LAASITKKSNLSFSSRDLETFWKSEKVKIGIISSTSIDVGSRYSSFLFSNSFSFSFYARTLWSLDSPWLVIPLWLTRALPRWLLAAFETMSDFSSPWTKLLLWFSSSSNYFSSSSSFSSSICLYSMIVALNVSREPSNKVTNHGKLY